MMVTGFKRHLYVRSDKLQIVPLSFKRLKISLVLLFLVEIESRKNSTPVLGNDTIQSIGEKHLRTNFVSSFLSLS